MTNLRTRYLADTIQTASPAQLLVMLYDRLLLDVDRAASALEGGDRAAASVSLVHAQDIVSELMSTLKVDAWDGAAGLMEVYNFLLRELVDANVSGNVDKARACRDLIEPLRDSWAQAAASLPAGGVSGELGVG